MEILLPQNQAPPNEPSKPQPIRILMVDDDKHILRLGDMVLKQLKHDVIICAEPSKALSIINENRDITLLITDVLMPGVSGQELYNQAKEIIPSLKCIFVSGYSSDVIDPAQLSSPHCRFLNKPFSVDTLGHAIKALSAR
ncbi:response regulator [Kiritimatiellota bacterium B12222]|nr:response regulator [Kiritimatiellota bacterium B12222]